MIQITKATRPLMPQLVPLIDDYQRFYKCQPNSARNVSFFSALLDTPSLGVQFIAMEGDRGVGFATLYFLPSSTTAKMYCLMNDLYTLPELRGKGVGRKLIEHCRQYALAHGYDSMEWMTQKENATAQRLYDSLSAQKTEWFTYSLETKPK